MMRPKGKRVVGSDGLTERQREVHAYLQVYQRSEGILPSTRTVQRRFGFASQTAAVRHLRALEQKGLLLRLPGAWQLREVRPYTEVPLLGNIAAGRGEPNEELREGCVAVDLASLGLPRNARTFALRVRGDSMIGAHIQEGDTVILEFKEPRHGDVVAALIDGETTLKRFLRRNGQPFLKAENPLYPDLIPARELVIQGVMVALLRTVRPGRSSAA